MRFFTPVFKNQKGVTFVELIMGMGIAVLVLGIGVVVFTQSQTILNDENDNAKIRAKGREAIKRLTKEIRMAGFGLPPGAGVTTIDTNSITFLANLEDERTTTPPGAPGTIAASPASTTITVVDGSEFDTGDKVVIYDPAFRQTELGVLTGASSGSLQVTSTLSNTYTYGLNAALITINSYNTITVALSGATLQKTVDGTTSTIMSDLDATGLSFDFLGETTPSLVKQIEITLSLVDPNNPDAVIDIKTEVDLRNFPS